MSELTVATGTPSVSKYSKVLPMSRIDLTPAQTTATGVLPNSVKSALMSIESSTNLCTPPIPPVTNMRMPAICASAIVDETVVAPFNRFATIIARSRRLVLIIDSLFSGLPINSISLGDRPIVGCPFNIPTVAATTFRFSRIRSTAMAHSTFFGYGIPWEIIVDSKATTGLPCFRA